MIIEDIQDALNNLWNDCGLGFATMFWGIIMLVSLPLGGWIWAVVCFFLWVGSAWFAVVGCFIVPRVDELPRRVRNLLPPSLIFIFLLIFAIAPPFLFMYYVLGAF